MTMPRIEMRLEPDAGGVCCISGITWPNGHYSEYRESSAEVGAELPSYDPQYDAAAGQTFAGGSGLDMIKRATASFDAYLTKRGYSKNHPPPDYKAMLHDYLLAHGWHKAKSKLGEFGDALKQSGKILLPIAANAVVPGAGTATAAFDTGKNVVDQVDHIDATIKAGKATASDIKNAERIASAKSLKSASDAVNNPRTQHALIKTGVDSASIKRAGHYLEATRNAVAAYALEQKGQPAAAAPYKAAAAKHAAAARVPAAKVQQAAQKVYYLAIVQPGGA
jgi:hypothetical protein